MFDRGRRNLLSRRRIPALPRMPWLVDEDTFVDNCTRCNKCLSACETEIIVKGDGGFPTVDFNRGECTFCTRCAQACPEPLFRPTTEAAWDVKAQVTQQCLAQNNVECRSCGDMCEVQAIRFKLQAGGVAQPVFELDVCNGCGACVATCPTSAITMITSQQEEK
ncbi:ferredoxin-type protein NapF [Photobacterium sanguinicancri]|uniref:Ferredoxin-type protein NapF n=1 Tax=Photobacterium sanguinicancri TaxID=875932 RepID=A0AAW7Y7F0_9GAMM|nr:ferredoxin-type protein NapF [Photobacterium sanguinicancri]MDO6497591.1 ferredoxin-type protein NapF [Photobacterium sanguinicancri]MDO6544297.1 ferredoxin-type protein NapF [Photobacterium sanguinicancri]